MRPTIRLGQVSGIDIGLHWTILLIGFVLVSALTGSVLPSLVPGLSGAAYLLAALSTAALFLGSIVAHELGHSIVAQRNGIEVKGITLFALGGIASLEREPDEPGVAARIALAGPAVSVGVGLGSLALAWMVSNTLGGSLMTAAITWLGIINLALAVFNMIPALPLDGGRVLQAALWKRHGQRHQATISAANVGRWLGWAIVAIGLWQFFTIGSGIWTALIGWFVITTAKAEGARAHWQLQQEQGAAQWPYVFSQLFANVGSQRPDQQGPGGHGPGQPGPGQPGSGQPGSGQPGQGAATAPFGSRYRAGGPSTSADEVIDVTGRPVSDDPTERPVKSPLD